MSMINDILDYSQISNGKLRLTREYFSLWEIIKEVSKLIKFQAKAKGLIYKVECNITSSEYDKKAYIKSDPNRLRQILLNLIGNALKFTSEGSLTVSLEANPKGYLVKVTDTGMGIKQEDKPKLFKLFGKLDMGNKESINQHGVGLGLAISQSLVKILNDNVEGAEIKVESEVGKGSCFYFPLLVREEDSFFKTTSQDLNEFANELEMKQKIQTLQRVFNDFHLSPPEEKVLETKRVLVVDDDQINILVATNFLKGFPDYIFKTASNGLEAIQIVKDEAISNEFFDVILMDCDMPKLDGFETTKIIKDLVAQKMIPSLAIIACTANASPLDYETCFKSGMTDYISKPFTKLELREKIERNYKKLKKNYQLRN